MTEQSRTVQIKVMAAAERGPGWAWLTMVTVQGNDFPEGTSPLACQLSLQRNQDGFYLGDNGQWRSAEVWHEIGDLRQTAQGTQVLLGPSLIDALLADSRMMCRARLVFDSCEFNGVLRFEPGVFASGAAGHVPQASEHLVSEQVQEVAPEPAPEPELPKIEPIFASPQERPQRPERKSGRLVLWLVLLLVLLAVIGWLAYRWWQPESSTQTQAPASSGDIKVQACSEQAMQSTQDDLQFLQQCVAAKPDSQTVLAVIEVGKKAQRCDLIQRLYAHQAQSGQADVALAYAREFDPSTFKGGCFAQPDVPTALYWYESVLQNDPDRADVASRIKQLQALQ